MRMLWKCREWLRRCGYLIHRATFAENIENESQFHLEMRISELEADGVPHAQANTQAHQEFGSLLRTQEDAREAWQFSAFERVLADAWYAARQFFKSPAFTLGSILSLTLGIGASTAVFSVIYGVLLHPFPYQGADRMVSFRVTETAGYNGFSNYLLLSARQFADIQKSPVLDGAIATDNWDMATTGEELPQAVHTGKLSANAFQYFRVSPILGREFTNSDGPYGEEPQRVVVLSYRFWQSHYRGDRRVLGKALQLDRENYTIIGVLPVAFTWFHSDVYGPLRLTGDPNRVAMIDARLRPGITATAAEASLYPLIESFQKETPAHFPRKPRLTVNKLNASTEDRFRGTLVVLFVAVLLLLVVGAANVSLLLLARAAARQHELAMRCALGASRSRIVQQLVTEAVCLAAVGCALGVGLAYLGVPMIVRWLPTNSFPNEAAIRIHVPVLLFSVLVSSASGLLCGLWPAFRSSRPDVAQVIQTHTQKAAGTTKGRRFRSMLIAGQVALTFVLLAGTASSIRTFLRLYLTPLGYDPSHLLTVALQFPDGTHLQLQDRRKFYSRTRQEVAEIPGVRSAAISPGFPPQAHFTRHLELFDQPTATSLNVIVNPVSREFFETLRIPLLHGSIWSQQETERGSAVAIVNQAFAHRYWPGGNVIGHRIRLPDFTAFTSWMLAYPNSNDWLLIDGVVGNTPNEGLSKPPAPAVYVPYSLVLGDSFNLAVRTEGNPFSLTKPIRESIHTLDAAQPVNEIRTAEDILADEGWAPEKFVASLFVIFSGLALVLAAVGLYSVIAFLVTQRYQEFGVRMALGASRRRILMGVLFSGSQSVASGLLAGFLLCTIVNGLLNRWTQGSIYDPIVLLSVPVVLLVVSVAASFFPAWKASSIEPMAALRQG